MRRLLAIAALTIATLSAAPAFAWEHRPYGYGWRPAPSWHHAPPPPPRWHRHWRAPRAWNDGWRAPRAYGPRYADRDYGWGYPRRW